MKNKKKYSSVPMFTHLRRKHKSLYNRWYQMQKRAGTLKAYRHVRVSPEFKGHQGFVNFYDHMGLPPTPQHQMDRINVYGHYEPGNLRWVTRDENMNNLKVHARGNGRLKKLAIRNGISTRTYYKRVWQGWDIEHAATWPPGRGFYRDRVKRI